jgi:hypothetical protein
MRTLFDAQQPDDSTTVQPTDLATAFVMALMGVLFQAPSEEQ